MLIIALLPVIVIHSHCYPCYSQPYLFCPFVRLNTNVLYSFQQAYLDWLWLTWYYVCAVLVSKLSAGWSRKYYLCCLHWFILWFVFCSRNNAANGPVLPGILECGWCKGYALPKGRVFHFPKNIIFENTISHLLKSFHMADYCTTQSFSSLENVLGIQRPQNGIIVWKSAENCQFHSNTANSCLQLDCKSSYFFIYT